MAELTLSPGLVGERSMVVCEHNVAPHVPRFSTPSMISLMEQAALAALDGRLPPDETSVGFEVHVRHLAPSSIGAIIVARAELAEVDRNRLTFNVVAFDGDTKIGEGTHRRAVINANR